MTKHTVRMSDVAENLGVSIVTVSKALSDKDGVSMAMRQKIKETALQMGYQYKNGSRKKLDTGTIGILMAEHLMKPEHSFYWALYLHLVERLKEQGYHNMLELVPLHLKKPELPHFLIQKKVDGIMVLGYMPDVYLDLFLGTELPIVQVDSYSESKKTYAVVANSFWGMAQMTQYLIEKGHKKIGFVGSTEKSTHSRDCYYGYLKALDAHKIALRKDWMLPDREHFTFKKSFNLPSDMPTAFVCCSDQCAYHFSSYLLQQGYDIPKDISVTGFYGHVFSTLISPQITTYKTDLSEMAACAVKAQMSLIESPEKKQGMCVVCGEIAERDSVGYLDGVEDGK